VDLYWLDKDYATDFAACAFNRGDAPREGFYRVSIPRWLRKKHTRDYLPARIFRPIPIDPDTGEILDRYPALAAEIDGTEIEVKFVWAFGEPIEEGDYEWLKAITPIKY